MYVHSSHAQLLFTLPIIVLLWAGSSGLSSHAQNLPSWAEPQSHQRSSQQPSQVDSRRGRDRRTNRTQRGHRTERSVQEDNSLGDFRTRKGPPGCTYGGCPEGQYCNPNKGGGKGKCFKDGTGPGNGNGGAQDSPSDVPISPVGLILLAGTGGAYAIRRLKSEGDGNQL